MHGHSYKIIPYVVLFHQACLDPQAHLVSNLSTINIWLLLIHTLCLSVSPSCIKEVISSNIELLGLYVSPQLDLACHSGTTKWPSRETVLAPVNVHVTSVKGIGTSLKSVCSLS